MPPYPSGGLPGAGAVGRVMTLRDGSTFPIPRGMGHPPHSVCLANPEPSGSRKGGNRVDVLIGLPQPIPPPRPNDHRRTRPLPELVPPGVAGQDEAGRLWDVVCAWRPHFSRPAQNLPSHLRSCRAVLAEPIVMIQFWRSPQDNQDRLCRKDRTKWLKHRCLVARQCAQARPSITKSTTPQHTYKKP